ncbi:MAG: hypothetical protein HKN26_00885, partial [Acidimicrobiales bacterium]|nr:hypothetical protein [Acidimicrobiales bacterium]
MRRVTLRLPAFPLRVWLILAVLIPALGVGFLALQDYREIQAEQRSADLIEVEIERIADLRLLQMWLAAESALDSVQSGLGASGVSVDDIITMMDSEIEIQATSDIRGLVDSAISELQNDAARGPSGEALRRELESIDDIRTRSDTGEISGEEVRAYFSRARALADATAEMLVDDVGQLNRDIGDPELTRWIDSLDSLSALMQARIDEIVNTSLVLTRFPGTEPHPTAALELAEANQRLDRAAATVSAIANPDLLTSLEAIHATESAQAYHELRVRIPEVLGLVDVDAPISVRDFDGTTIVLGGFSVLPEEADLLTEAKAQAQAQAADAANLAAQTQQRRLVSLAVVVAMAI